MLTPERAFSAEMKWYVNLIKLLVAYTSNDSGILYGLVNSRRLIYIYHSFFIITFCFLLHEIIFLCLNNSTSYEL